MRIDSMANLVYALSMDKPRRLSEQLRDVIRRDGRSLNEIWAASGVDSGQLSRFMRSERDFRLSSAERVLDSLGVECRLIRPRRRKGG